MIPLSGKDTALGEAHPIYTGCPKVRIVARCGRYLRAVEVMWAQPESTTRGISSSCLVITRDAMVAIGGP
jgi:hypothetical protein